MKRLLVILVLVFLSSCGSDGPVEATMEALGLTDDVDVTATTDDALPTSGVVDQVLTQLDSDGFNGIVLIDDGGEPQVATFGTADGPNGPPITEDTVFDIGSLTKQFTGAAIVRLEMDGLVAVDEPVGTYLAELSGPLAEVTLHQLLIHAAGLPDGIGDDYEQIDRAAFLERAMDRMGTPGEFRYSNVGYSLLGMVIESVTGDSYEQYLQDALFDPAGMTSTGYVLPDWNERTIAVGYDGEQRLQAPNELPWADDGPWWNLRANGGILSTAADMRRWHQALQTDDILSDAAQQKLFDQHISEGEGSASFYGYGWVSFPLEEGRWFNGHNGGNGIFFADILRFPDENLMIFVATNTSGADEDAALRLAGQFVESNITAVCAPLGDITELPQLQAFPATDAGRAGDAFTTILQAGDGSARRAFAEQHVSATLAQGLTLDEQADELALLQQEFAEYTIDAIYQQDDTTFHLMMHNPPASDQIVLSIGTDIADASRIACVNIEQP